MRLADWSEFDLDAGLWTIPARRTKTNTDLRMPLPPQAVSVVQMADTLEPSRVGLVFPSPTTRKALSDAAFNELLAEHLGANSEGKPDARGVHGHRDGRRITRVLVVAARSGVGRPLVLLAADLSARRSEPPKQVPAGGAVDAGPRRVRRRGPSSSRLSVSTKSFRISRCVSSLLSATGTPQHHAHRGQHYQCRVSTLLAQFGLRRAIAQPRWLDLGHAACGGRRARYLTGGRPVEWWALGLSLGVSCRV